jgi:hypothetical protein
MFTEMSFYGDELQKKPVPLRTGSLQFELLII